MGKTEKNSKAPPRRFLRRPFMHPVWRFLNNVRQLSWYVIGLGCIFLVAGFLGLIEGQIPYPAFIGTQLIYLHRTLASDFVAIGITVIIIDTANRWRDVQSEKRRLIRQLRSTVNEEAVRAVEELRAAGWLNDGSLRAALLVDANLQSAKLFYANLSGVHLAGANLQGARLEGSNLQDAKMWLVNLQNASLIAANLRGSYLGEINFEGTDLTFANLQEAKDLTTCKFNENTALPDGTMWAPDTDMNRFTDPEHPQFWQSY